MELKITNSLGRKKEIFKPIEDKKVKLYVCGVTPYDYSHLGHGRAYVNFDVFVRLLKFLGYNVNYVRNITDIDDKLINKAIKEGDLNNYKKIAEKFTKFYHEDMQALNCLSPDIEPKATEHIKQMIDFIKQLIENKNAYVIDHDVYFDVSSFGPYGKLSGKKLEDLQAGARVGIDERKKNPADFALWKGNDKELFWKSPWGHGRPGWHIECSVMAKEYFGETLDVHGGGADLTFPHHENEIAQSESLHNKPFANYWMHNAFLNINKEKMSKSLGNFFTLKQVFENFDPMVLRFYFLQHHYRSPIELNFDDLKASQTAYERLINSLKIDTQTKDLENISLQDLLKHSFMPEIMKSLCDDINTPKALGIIFKNIDKIKESKDLILVTRYFLKHVLGLTLEAITKEVKITKEIEDLVKEREKARADKNWALADKIRDQLNDMGYVAHDKKLKS